MVRVYIASPSPRAEYAIGHVLKRMLGWPFEFIRSAEEFRNCNGPKLWYGPPSIDAADGFIVISSGWLDPKGTGQFEPPVGMMDGVPVLFPSDEGHDLFAGTFFLLSRYEEYSFSVKDEHGRLPSAKHFVVKHGMERMPVVDHWALQFAKKIRSRFPELPEPDRRYGHTITVDIDNGLKYLGRPFWKQGGAAIRDLVKGSRSLAAERISVLRGGRKDPYEVHERLLEVARSNTVDRVIAFILVQGGRRFDHAADITHPTMLNAIRLLEQGAVVGIHPSYESSVQEELIAVELKKLMDIAGSGIQTSRQHFLRWKMPDTLRALERAGILEEHSMGFSDRPGFRAGTCTPFQWYDLEQERMSDLVLHPFAVMDSAHHDRLGLRPKEAMEECLQMSEAVRKVHGQFISVWHDRFLSGHSQWAGWPEAFRQVVENAAP